MFTRNEFGVLSTNLFGFEFGLRRTPPEKKSWGLNAIDMQRILDQGLRDAVVQSPGGGRGISVPDLKGMHRETAKKILEDEGILVVPELKEDSSIDLNNLKEEISSLLEKYSLQILSGEEFEDSLLSITPKAVDYYTLAKMGKTCINLRGKGCPWDQGMIDIFNPHIALRNSFSKLYNRIQEMNFQEIVSAISPGEWSIENTNIYVNQGVSNTRGFHVDDYGYSSYKIFVYLTDVLRLEDGPYCFIRGSQNSGTLFEKINRSIARDLGRNQWDVFVADRTKVIPLLAPKGALIISNQSGAHRGFPQSPDGNRMVAVFHLYKSK